MAEKLITLTEKEFADKTAEAMAKSTEHNDGDAPSMLPVLETLIILKFTSELQSILFD